MLGESQEAILTARHVQFCRTPCMPIVTLPMEPFVYLVSVLHDLGMSVSCSYHVITSSLLWGDVIGRGHNAIIWRCPLRLFEVTSVSLLLPGAQFVADASFRHEFDTGWNNAMHEYDTTTSKWCILPVSFRGFPCNNCLVWGECGESLGTRLAF